jgi:hypothetical protein
MTTNYAQITNIAAMDLPIPEIDVACFENIQIQSQLQIVPDPSYCHRIVLNDIDISANLFKKLFYDTSTTSPNFNTLTNSFTDYIFSLLPAPLTGTDVTYSIPGFPDPVGYYAVLSKYISLMAPYRKKYPSNDPFSLQDDVLDHIVLDLNSAYPSFLELFNTCSFIEFNKEMTNIKTLNDLIPSASVNASCALNWNNILELVRAEYDEVEDAVSNWTVPNAIAILKITIVVKTTLVLTAMAVDNLVSTTEVVFRYKVNFSEL